MSLPESTIHISMADPFSPEGRRLVEPLWEEEGELYGDTGPCRFQPSDIAGPGCAQRLCRAWAIVACVPEKSVPRESGWPRFVFNS